MCHLLKFFLFTFLLQLNSSFSRIWRVCNSIVASSNENKLKWCSICASEIDVRLRYRSSHRKVFLEMAAPKFWKLKVRSFLEIFEEYLCCPDKNYYFCKYRIPVFNLLVCYRKMIEVSKICVCKKLDRHRSRFHQIQRISVLYFFWMGHNFWKCIW